MINNTAEGLIVSSYGRIFLLEVSGAKYTAVTKSKKTDFVVGDFVTVDIINAKQAQITGLVKRKNLIYRSDSNRSKIIASNISQILIVIAIKPNFNINVLNSCLICAEAENIEPIIIVNKADLPESKEFIQTIEDLYKQQLNYIVLSLSAIQDCKILSPYLENNSSLLIGQSGIGKSTIINHILPDKNVRIGRLSQSENSGTHTTTNANLYHINLNSNIIDCPGLQDFGLYHLDVVNLINYFPELQEYIGECKFRNCRHLNEPGCAIVNAHNQNKIATSRFKYLQYLTLQLLNKPNF